MKNETEDIDCSTRASRIAHHLDGLLLLLRGTWQIATGLLWIALGVGLLSVAFREVTGWL